MPLGGCWGTYTPHLDSIMRQLYMGMCAWNGRLSSVVQGSVARCAFGRCWSTYTPLSLSCAPGLVWCAPPRGRGSGVPSTGRVWCALYGEGLVCSQWGGSGVPSTGRVCVVCPQQGGFGVPSPQRVWCALHGEGLVYPPSVPSPQRVWCALNGEGLVCPQRGGSGVLSTGRVWCTLHGEGLVCPPQGGSGVPPLTFVVIVIIIIVFLIILFRGVALKNTKLLHYRE